MQKPNLDDLARIALAHASMIREIEEGRFKGKPNDVAERKAWLTRTLPQLQSGESEHQSVAAEILDMLGLTESVQACPT